MSFLRQMALRKNQTVRMLSPQRTGCDGTDGTIDDNIDIYDPISNEPAIPSSNRIRDETTDVQRKRLLYQSRKRGKFCKRMSFEWI